MDLLLGLEVLALDELRDVLIVRVVLLRAVLTLLLLQALVALGELSQGSEGVGAELVEDAGDELGELLVLTVSVDGEGVGGDGGVDCARVLDREGMLNCHSEETYPWGQRSG